MRKCIKITVYGNVKNESYHVFIQQKATSLSIEGTIKNNDDASVVIYACGSADNLDGFIDHVYKGSKASIVDDVHIEPFINEKDYRGAFRIIM